MNRLAAILYGNSPHHLDHLAPLASLLEIPLIVDDKKTLLFAKKYYPHLSSSYCDPEKLYFFVTHHFDRILTCIPKPMFHVDFFLAENLLKKTLRTIWCPHGNSDKGRSCFFMEGLQQEELLLIYGKRMEEFLQEKGVSSPQFSVGNYRYQYFLQHKKFYEDLVKKELFSSLDPEKKTILYAPTWKDRENSSSFEKFLSPLLQSFDRTYNLIIKPHPNLFLSHYWQMERLLEDTKKIEGMLVLQELPIIYPLLHFTDIYLGDMSSIGYDFLTFQRPMFFLVNPDHIASESSYFLHRCGYDLSQETPSHVLQKIKALLEKKEESRFSTIQKQVYEATFSQDPQIEMLKTALTQEKDSL